jgi:hypothetical protein
VPVEVKYAVMAGSFQIWGPDLLTGRIPFSTFGLFHPVG